MTREEEIQKEAIEIRCAIATSVSGDNYSSIDDLPFIEGKISYDELVEKAFIKGAMWADAHPAKKHTVTIEEINALIKELQPNEGQVSDGYHTFDELYDFRREYNAALVNTHIYPCHKSLRHSDGEMCFGGGWFIVMINLPTGQISNHYETKYWDEFDCEERECSEPWDGHTEKDVLARLYDLNLNSLAKRQTATIEAWVARDNHKDIGKNTDLFFTKEYPILNKMVGTWGGMEVFYPLPQDALPSVTFENSPKKVKVTIELEDEQ